MGAWPLMCSMWSESAPSKLNHGQSQPFHLTPQIMQNSAPHRLFLVSMCTRASKIQYSPSHVVASFLEFNHGSAFVAPLPAFVLGLLQEPGSFFVSWAPSWVVPFAIAGYTNLRFATATASHLTSRITVAMDVGWLDPFATFSHWAVHTVSCRIFGKLAVPRLLERAIEQLVHVV